MSSTSGGGGPPISLANQDTNNEHSNPGQVSGHSAWAGAGALGGASLNNRTFEQIIELSSRGSSSNPVRIAPELKMIL